MFLPTFFQLFLIDFQNLKYLLSYAKNENAIFHIETSAVIQSFLCVYEKNEAI